MENTIKIYNLEKEISDDLICQSAKSCFDRNGGENTITNLKQKAKDCKTKEDYIKFFMNLGLNVEESERGIILHLNKTECTCPMVKHLNTNKECLCDCTKTREKVMWSQVLGKDIDIHIVESFLRGGNDCVLELVL